jgi:hypothetical protein
LPLIQKKILYSPSVKDIRLKPVLIITPLFKNKKSWLVTNQSGIVLIEENKEILADKSTNPLISY